MVVTHDEVREVGEGLLGLGAAGDGLVFERDVSAVLPAREGDAFNDRLLAARLAGVEIDRAVPAIGEVVADALFEGGILVAGKFFDSGIPEALASGGINKR